MTIINVQDLHVPQHNFYNLIPSIDEVLLSQDPSRTQDKRITFEQKILSFFRFQECSQRKRQLKLSSKLRKYMSIYYTYEVQQISTILNDPTE